MKKDPKDIVRDGYDRIAEQYDEYRSHFSDEAELDEFMRLVKPGGHVLDVGCGPGNRVTRALVDSGFQVKEIDFSQKMIDLAKHHVPEATFEVGDMTALEFEDDSFDGIVIVSVVEVGTLVTINFLLSKSDALKLELVIEEKLSNRIMSDSDIL